MNTTLPTMTLGLLGATSAAKDAAPAPSDGGFDDELKLVLGDEDETGHAEDAEDAKDAKDAKDANLPPAHLLAAFVQPPVRTEVSFPEPSGGDGEVLGKAKNAVDFASPANAGAGWHGADIAPLPGFDAAAGGHLADDARGEVAAYHAVSAGLGGATGARETNGATEATTAGLGGVVGTKEALATTIAVKSVAGANEPRPDELGVGSGANASPASGAPTDKAEAMGNGERSVAAGDETTSSAGANDAMSGGLGDANRAVSGRLDGANGAMSAGSGGGGAATDATKAEGAGASEARSAALNGVGDGKHAGANVTRAEATTPVDGAGTAAQRVDRIAAANTRRTAATNDAGADRAPARVSSNGAADAGRPSGEPTPAAARPNVATAAPVISEMIALPLGLSKAPSDLRAPLPAPVAKIDWNGTDFAPAGVHPVSSAALTNALGDGSFATHILPATPALVDRIAKLEESTESASEEPAAVPALPVVVGPAPVLPPEPPVKTMTPAETGPSGQAHEAVRVAESLGHKRVLTSGEARGHIVVPELGRIEVRAHTHAIPGVAPAVHVNVQVDDAQARAVVQHHASELRAHVHADVPTANIHLDQRGNYGQSERREAPSHDRDGDRQGARDASDAAPEATETERQIPQRFGAARYVL